MGSSGSQVLFKRYQSRWLDFVDSLPVLYCVAMCFLQAEKLAYEKMVESVSESYEKSLEKNKQLLAESVLQRESLSKLNVEIFRLNTLLEAAAKEKTALEAQVKAAAGVQAAMQKNQEATFAALMQAQTEV